MANLDVEKYRKMLWDERARIRAEMDVLEEDVSYDDTGSNTSELADYDNHPADQGTDTFEKEKDQAMLDNWRGLIGRIDEALGKIDRGTYGTCDRCGREISKKRLDAVPYAIFCVECQDIVESR